MPERGRGGKITTVILNDYPLIGDWWLRRSGEGVRVAAIAGDASSALGLRSADFVASLSLGLARQNGTNYRVEEVTGCGVRRDP